MRRITFHPQQLTGTTKTEWDTWQAEASTATAAVIQAWEKWRASGSAKPFKYSWKASSVIWKKLKDWLLKNVFDDKCAYCETSLPRSSYQAEHFRPKGGVSHRVAGRKGMIRPTIQDEDGRPAGHPGYFWLAYHWENLFPSCEYCNTANGKKEQFPVALTHVAVRRLTPADIPALIRKETASLSRPGVYYLQPEDLDALEQPLLLNPYLDDPCQHLSFGDGGVVTHAGQSLKGQASLAVYDLQAERLRQFRQEACDNALNDYNLAYSKKGLSIPQRRGAARAAVAGYMDGTRPYSAAVVAFLRLNHADHGL